MKWGFARIPARVLRTRERRWTSMKMFRRDKGFTLVELMVVVLIIGILVAIAIPVFNAARAKAEERSCFSNQRNIEGAYQTYRASEMASPTAISDLVPTYIKETPYCPADNDTYYIDATSDDVFDSDTSTAGCSTHGAY
jgi:type IV pilus assembly protein PilA